MESAQSKISQLLTLGLLFGASIWLGTRKHPDDLASSDAIGGKSRYVKRGKGSASDTQIGWWSIEVKVTGFGETTDLDALLVTEVSHTGLAGTSYDGSGEASDAALGYIIGGGKKEEDCDGQWLGEGYLSGSPNNSSKICHCMREGQTYGDTSTYDWDGSWGADCNLKFKHIGCNDPKPVEYDPNGDCDVPDTAFAHPIDHEDIMTINVPFLIGGTCILLAISLGLMLLAEQSDTFNIRKQLGYMLGGELVVMEPVYSYISAIFLALVIFACMLTTLCVMRATISVVQSNDMGVSVGEILYLMFFAAVMCTSFFIEVEDKLTRSTVRDLLSAVGGVLACLFFAQIYLESSPKAEHLMYPMYVGTIVFLAVYITTSAIRSIPLVGNTTIARSVGSLLENPRVLTTVFALSTLITAYVTARHCQNLLDGDGESGYKLGEIAYQSGLKSTECNFIGTKDMRDDKFVFEHLAEPCKSADGSYSWMLYGCWLVPLLVYVGHAVITNFTQAQKIVDEARRAAGDLVQVVQTGGSKLADGNFRKGPTLPTRYSRIRVETSV